MSKLSFRARALDAAKPMPIFVAEELPDLPDYSAINRAVPQMPSGMQKEEECEHHLQRAICAGLIIPTPEVSDMPQKDFYDIVCPADYKQPRQLIHMQPFTMEADTPDYDMDSDDELWLHAQTQRLDLTPLKFEEMMDRLEKSSGQTVVTIHEAKALLKEDDDLIIAVFDYWLNKRLKTQHPLIWTVKTEQRAGQTANSPYLAFRRRTEKMQTRKNRKNDEAGYEKMLKLRRDLCRAVTLLELVKRREKIKREFVHLTVEVFEKRYQARDFSGAIVAEANANKPQNRPAFQPIFHNHYTNQGWSAGNKTSHKDDVMQRREKRPYNKKRNRHKSVSLNCNSNMDNGGSDDDATIGHQFEAEAEEEVEDEGQFAFKRKKLCTYHMPRTEPGNWSWCSKEDNGGADERFRFTLTSVQHPRPRCVGFARRRIGRGGRIILDRVSTNFDDFWRTHDFSIVERHASTPTTNNPIKAPPVDDDEPALPPIASSLLNTSVVQIKTEACDEDSSSSASVFGNGVRTHSASASDSAPLKLEDTDDMVDFLRSVRSSWLHFRPKTPPLIREDDWGEPAPIMDDLGPFAMEIEAQDSAYLLDSAPFVTQPFVFDLDDEVVEDEDDLEEVEDSVPVTDTRQHLEADSDSDSGVVGCSRFAVRDRDAQQPAGAHRPHEQRRKVPKAVVNNTITTSTLTSPKLNSSVNRVAAVVSKTNGVPSLAAFDTVSSNATRTKPNKLYAYPSTLSLHTAAHALTLNSHSANNILEIPLSADGDSVVKCEGNGKSPASTKTKPIVRKNNIIMEVT